MKSHHRALALLLSLVLACGTPLTALCSEAAPTGETDAAMETVAVESPAAADEESEADAFSQKNGDSEETDGETSEEESRSEDLDETSETLAEASAEEANDSMDATTGVRLAIVIEPEDVSAAAGETVSLSVEVNKEDVYYQWQWSKDGNTWKDCSAEGFDTDTFEFAMKETLNGRLYRCMVFDDRDELLTRRWRSHSSLKTRKDLRASPFISM